MDAAIPIQRLNTFARDSPHGNYSWAPEFLGLGPGLPSAIQVASKYKNLRTIHVSVRLG